jgi:hypothetical protein
MTEPIMGGLLAILVDIEASQEQTIAKMVAHSERMETNMNAWRNKMKARQKTAEAYTERTETRIETDQERMEAEIKTCLVEVEATDLDANPEEKGAVDEQQEVPRRLQ